MRSVEQIAAGGYALRVSWNQTEHFGRGRRETLPSAQLFGNNGVSFWLFQLFPAEKPGGFPSPESGTGCIGLSTALSQQPPRGQDRRDRALRSPEGRPGGTHSQRLRRVPLRPLGHPWSRCARRNRPVPHDCSTLAGSFVPTSSVRLIVECGKWERRRDSRTRTASNIKLMKEVTDSMEEARTNSIGASYMGQGGETFMESALEDIDGEDGMDEVTDQYVGPSAKAEFAYRAGYDGMGRVSVTHVVERGYSAMLKQPEMAAA